MYSYLLHMSCFILRQSSLLNLDHKEFQKITALYVLFFISSLLEFPVMIPECGQTSLVFLLFTRQDLCSMRWTQWHISLSGYSHHPGSHLRNFSQGTNTYQHGETWKSSTANTCSLLRVPNKYHLWVNLMQPRLLSGIVYVTNSIH